MLIIIGLIFYEGIELNSLKLLIVFIIVAIVNPVGAHALTRAAYNLGLKPWFKKKNEEDK
jgi:monovalent cation/proton antiporter MnhG/PhaG subunit